MASEVDLLVQSIANRRHAARIRGVVAGVAFGLACVLAYVIAESWSSKSTIRELLVLLAQSGMVGWILVGYAVYARAAAPREVLIWLRKFWPKRGRRMRFPSMLGQASAGVAYPVTLQDSSFSTSYYSGALRLWVLAPILIFAWTVGFIVVAMLASVLNQSDQAAFVLLLVVYTAGFVWLVLDRLKHFGLRTLKAGSAVHEIADSLDKARRGHKYLGLGVEVFRCPREPEDLWEKVVTTALKRTSIVIIDVTNVKESAPIRWELRQALSLLDPRDIILAVEEGSVSPDRLWNEICEPVQRSLGLALSRRWLNDALFTYPATEANLVRRKQQYRQVTQTLRKKILLRAAERTLAGTKRVAHSPK